MRRILVLPSVALVVLVAGCGNDSEKIKEEQKALITKYEQERADLTQQLQEAKKDQALKKVGPADSKGDRTDKDVEALNKAKKDAETLANDRQTENERLRTLVEQAGRRTSEMDEELKKQKEAVKALTQEVEKQKASLTEATAAQVKASEQLKKEKEENLQAITKLNDETRKLKTRLAQLGPNPSVVSDAKAYENTNTMIVGFISGKGNEAQFLCQALGFKVLNVNDGDENGNRLLCQFSGPMTVESLNVLKAATTIVRYIQPNRRARPTSQGPSIPPQPRSRTEVAPERPSQEGRDAGGTALPPQPSATEPGVPPAPSNPPGSTSSATADGSPSGGRRSAGDQMPMDRLWWLRSIHAPEAWAVVGTPSRAEFEPYLVAVIDTGLDYEHEDLKPHLYLPPESMGPAFRHGVSFNYSSVPNGRVAPRAR